MRVRSKHDDLDAGEYRRLPRRTPRSLNGSTGARPTEMWIDRFFIGGSIAIPCYGEGHVLHITARLAETPLPRDLFFRPGAD